MAIDASVSLSILLRQENIKNKNGNFTLVVFTLTAGLARIKMILRNLKGQAQSFLDQYRNQSPAGFAAAQQAIGGLLILDGFFGIPHPFGGKKRPGIFGSITGIVVGIIFLIIPIFIGSLTGINKLTATTNAKVVSVQQHQSTTTNSNGTQQTSTSCTAVATYTVNGQQYTQQSSMGSSSLCSLTQGQLTKIYYNPKNPGQWGSDVKTIGLILKAFYIAGILIIISSLTTFIIRLLSIIFGWKLLKSGRKLAKTLPPGTDLTTAIKEVENSFKSSLFGFESNAASPMSPNVSPVQMQSPIATVSPQQNVPSQSYSPQPETAINTQDQTFVQPQVVRPTETNQPDANPSNDNLPSNPQT